MAAQTFEIRMLELGRVIDALATDQFWSALCQFLDTECEFNEIAVFSYFAANPPARLYDHHSRPERDHLHNDLLRSAYLIGPYFHRVVKPQRDNGFYNIDQIAPDAFKETEYYRIYFREKHVADEGMFFVRLDDVNSIGILCEKTLPSRGFDAEQLIRLGDIAPLICALATKQHQLIQKGTAQSASQLAMTSMLESFGSEYLSHREKQIAELILRGHSSKSGARELGISPETVRVHRKRLYQKLGVASHAELFWLFIRAAEYHDATTERDPLVRLLAND